MNKFETAADVFEDAKLGYNTGICNLVMASAFGSEKDKATAKAEFRTAARALGQAAKFAAKNKPTDKS